LTDPGQIIPLMPSPIGHILAGTIVCLAGTDSRERSRTTLGVTLLGSVFADFDFLPGIFIGDPGLFHHGPSHSLTFSVLFGVVVFLVCRCFSDKAGAVRAAALGAFAYSVHVILDLISVTPGRARGLPVMWPFSNDQFGFDLMLLGHFHHGGLQQGIWSVVRWDNVPAVLSELIVLGLPLFLLFLREQCIASRARPKANRPAMKFHRRPER
jgi:hypothetical protein